MCPDSVHPRAVFLKSTPQFTIPDVIAAARYYCDVLGFENRGFFGEPPVFVMVGRGVVDIFFSQDPKVKGQARPRSAIAYDAYIHVNSVEALAAELKRRGAAIVEGPVTRVYGMRELIVEDCHGLRLAFGEDPEAPGEPNFG